uniref:Cytoplasmic antigen 1 n=1 Tax=Taenia asiatica TaxID=60517 RepID=A3F523_TAEAS|nr:cytoplasmic antigen 1 [Taenia asiatica]
MAMVLRGGRYDNQLWNECGGAKSFVDDLMFCRGDVSTRAAITLRGVESYPYLT